jgi:hypothetical protein
MVSAFARARRRRADIQYQRVVNTIVQSLARRVFDVMTVRLHPFSLAESIVINTALILISP